VRIGIYNPYLDTLGGGEKYMLTAASCLSQSHEISVFWDSDDILKTAEKKFNINLSKVFLARNIFSLDTSLIKRLIDTRAYDAIFFLSDGSIPLVSCDLYVHFQFPVEWINVDSFVMQQKIKKIKKIICNSLYTKKYIDLKFKKDSILVYPPTYFKSDFPTVNLENKKNYILSVGRYNKFTNGTSFKKQELMISVFKEMIDKKKLKDWKLHLVISYAQKDLENIQKIKDSVKNYPIEILENVSHDTLQEEYSQAKIYWHAAGFGEDLITHPQRAEHFGITTVEAMINGAVPVVIDAGGQKETVADGQNGYLWISTDDLINKTVALIEDNTLMQRLSKKAVKDAHHFSTDKFCENINKVFSK
jgi:glycosyltransferase involved in cell wall biosynthesis